MHKHAKPPAVWKKETKGNRNRLKNGTINKKKRGQQNFSENFLRRFGKIMERDCESPGPLDVAAAAAEKTLQYEEKCLSVKVRCEC